MRRVFLLVSTAAATVCLTVGARAADVSAPAVHDWSGFYIGANAGAAWSNGNVSSSYVDTIAPDVVANEFEGDLNGQTAFTAGAILGFNYQFDQVVLGIEADFNYLGFDDSINKTRLNPDVPIITPDYYSHLDWSTNWYGTVRARLGYAIDNVLIYGTGGLAYGDVQASGNLLLGDKPFLKGSMDEVRWGWTVGGGAEYAVADRWTVGAEYLYVDLGSSNFDYKEVNTTGFAADAKVDYRFSVARATIKYAF